MVFCGKAEATAKNGKVKKGYRVIECKNGTVKYKKENTVTKATKSAMKSQPNKSQAKKAEPKKAGSKPKKSQAKKAEPKKAGSKPKKRVTKQKMPDLPTLERKDTLEDYAYSKVSQPLTIL